MNAMCLNDMYSVKQLTYSMHQSVKLVQPQRKNNRSWSQNSLMFGDQTVEWQCCIV